MLSDVIYGPRMNYSEGGAQYGTITVRSVLIDLEGLLEAVAVAQLPHHFKEVTYSVRNGREPRRILEADLAGLGPSDRQSLSIYIKFEQRHEDGSVARASSVEINFRRGRATAVRALKDIHPSGTSRPSQMLALPVARALLKDGAPIVPWRQHAPHLVMLPALLMVGCWLLLLGSYEFLPPAVLLGWTALLSVGVGAVAIDRYLAKRVAGQVPGVRIREESRAKTASRRADSKRDLKVIVLTAVFTILGGVILAILTNGFGLIPPD